MKKVLLGFLFVVSFALFMPVVSASRNPVYRSGFRSVETREFSWASLSNIYDSFTEIKNIVAEEIEYMADKGDLFQAVEELQTHFGELFYIDEEVVNRSIRTGATFRTNARVPETHEVNNFLKALKVVKHAFKDSLDDFKHHLGMKNAFKALKSNVKNLFGQALDAATGDLPAETA